MILTPLRARLIAILLHAVVVLTHAGPRALLWAQQSGEKEKWVTSAITQEDNRGQTTTNPFKTPQKHKDGGGGVFTPDRALRVTPGQGFNRKREAEARNGGGHPRARRRTDRNGCASPEPKPRPFRFLAFSFSLWMLSAGERGAGRNRGGDPDHGPGRGSSPPG